MLIVSTDLQQRYTVDDYFNGQWYATIIIQTNDGTPANGLGTTTKQVRDYAQSSGTLTVWGTALADESSDHVEFDLYNTFHPDDYKRAYNRARQAVFPRLAAHKDHKGIITDGDTLKYTVPSAIRQIDRVSLGQAVLASHGQNLLTDGGFENWTSGSLDSWTLSGSNSTVNQEESTTGPTNHMVLTGNSSVRLYVEDTTTTLLETLTPSVASQMVEVSMSAYVYCRVGSAITLSLDGNNNTSNYHGGTGWELLQYNTTTDHSDASFTAGFYGNASVQATSYIDRCLLYTSPSPRD